MLKKTIAMVLSIVMIFSLMPQMMTLAALPAVGSFPATTTKANYIDAGTSGRFADDFDRHAVTSSTFSDYVTTYSSDVFANTGTGSSASLSIEAEEGTDNVLSMPTTSDSKSNALYTKGFTVANGYTYVFTYDLKITKLGDPTSAKRTRLAIRNDLATAGSGDISLYDSGSGSYVFQSQGQQSAGSATPVLNKWYTIYTMIGRGGYQHTYLIDKETGERLINGWCTTSLVGKDTYFAAAKIQGYSQLTLEINNAELQIYDESKYAPGVKSSSLDSGIVTGTKTASVTFDQPIGPASNNTTIGTAGTASITTPSGDVVTCTVKADSKKLNTFNITWEDELAIGEGYALNLKGFKNHSGNTADCVVSFNVTDESGTDTPEEPEDDPNGDIIKEIARAYYNQKAQILYDQDSDVARRSLSASPEDATAQKTVYLDCSSFVNSIYREGFGVNVLDMTLKEHSPNTKNFCSYASANSDAADVVGHWNPADYTTDESKAELVSWIKSNLKVGDILNYRHTRNSQAGHVYIYLGNETFMHCYAGGSYVINKNNPAASYDSNQTEETKGQIGNIYFKNLFEDSTSERYIFEISEENTVDCFSILRPLARELTPTEETVNRMQIAGLDMEKTASVFVNSSVYTGDTITYTVTLTNNNVDNLTGVTLSDTLPEGVEFVSGSNGVSVSGQLVSWTGRVVALDTTTITYTVRVTSQIPGTVLKSDKAYVSGVKLGDISHTVSGLKANQAALISSKAQNYAVNSAAFESGLDLACSLYKSALGVDILDYTSPEAMLDELIDSAGYTCRADTDLSKALVPNLFGGTDIRLGNRLHADSDRTRLISEEELAVGDILVAEWSGGNVVYVYIGDSRLATVSDGVCTLLTIGDDIYGDDADNILISLLAYDRFAVIRPSMMDIEPVCTISGISEDKKSVYVNIPKDGNFTIVFADYEDDVLNDLEVLPVDITAIGEKTVTMTKDITLSLGDKVMLINTIEAIVPQCLPYILN